MDSNGNPKTFLDQEKESIIGIKRNKNKYG